MRLVAISAAALALASQHDRPAAPSGAAGHGAAGSARTTEVEQTFAAFSPARIDVVTGDSVMWHNASVRPHTVTATDGSFDSGRMSAGRAYIHEYGTAGVRPYHCTLHAGMIGEVRVHDVLLRAPEAPASPGRDFPVRGRTMLPAGTPVTLEADEGRGFVPVAGATVGEDGTFATTVRPEHTASYRAVAADRASPPAQLLVLDRHLHASVRRRGRTLTVDVRVTPASPGDTVVLQLDLRHRFGWWPVRRARLDARSRATFRMRLRHAPRARVLLTLPDGATQLASSGPLRTR
jgi:plastocyanin